MLWEVCAAGPAIRSRRRFDAMPIRVTDLRAEMQALLTRAADMEARRQLARDRGDELAMRQHESELRRLWARYTALDRSNDTQQPTEATR